jgi:hypothetical protein
MKKILLVLICVMACASFSELVAQGCVAIRSTGGSSCTRPMESGIEGSPWLLNINNRYFKSYKHFRGKHEEVERVENGTEVINHTYNMDLFLSRDLDRRWSIAVNIPFIWNSRSSLYEHGGNNAGKSARHTTHSTGIGDLRFSVYRWILDPAKHQRFNVQAGLGIKLPTGDYQYMDYFYKSDTTKVLGPVDQSIQLGDGGTGLTTEINAFYSLTHNISLYGNFYYLLNPREQNGTSTARGGTPSATAIKYGSDVMSVPDQYMIRAGGNFSFNRFMASIGVRQECITVYDLVGGDNGFRRPGYVFSVEPGINYTKKKVTAYAYVPIAVIRNRTQSVPDKLRTEDTGVYAHGDAAFADYAINVGISVRF